MRWGWQSQISEMALKVEAEADTLKAKVGALQRVVEGLTKQFEEAC